MPALVAAIVTLLIEYLAKPRLEARKERLLERARDERSLTRALSLVHISFAALSDPAALGNAPAFARAEVRRATEYVQRVRESSVTLLIRLPEATRSLLGRSAGFALAKIMILEEVLVAPANADALAPAARGLKEANGQIAILLDYLLCPSWRPLRKVRCFEAVRQANEKLARTAA